MVQKLTALYNTLSLIETKGEATITMADCLKFTRQLIAEAQAEAAEEAKKADSEKTCEEGAQ